MVKVYSTSTCPFCEQLKNFLRGNDVEFEDIDVSESEEDKEEMVEKSGQMGVPVVDVDGEVVIGFKKDKLKELLDL